MPRQAKCGKQPPEKHFELAQAVAALYGSEWGAAPVERFRQEVEWHRTRLRKRNQLDWMVYIFRLVLTLYLAPKATMIQGHGIDAETSRHVPAPAAIITMGCDGLY